MPLCLPCSRCAARLATRPTGCSAASMTCHRRSIRPAVGTYVDMELPLKAAATLRQTERINRSARPVNVLQAPNAIRRPVRRPENRASTGPRQDVGPGLGPGLGRAAEPAPGYADGDAEA